MVYAYFEYLTSEYSRGPGHRVLLVQLHGLATGQSWALVAARRMPTSGAAIQRARSPFPDGVARAPAATGNLQKLARDYGPFGRGLRDAWETIIITSQRGGGVLKFRLDCPGDYGGGRLPMLWHDQTKVGNYGKPWIDDLHIGRWVPHQPRRSLAISMLRSQRKAAGQRL